MEEEKRDSENSTTLGVKSDLETPSMKHNGSGERKRKRDESTKKGGTEDDDDDDEEYEEDYYDEILPLMKYAGRGEMKQKPDRLNKKYDVMISDANNERIWKLYTVELIKCTPFRSECYEDGITVDFIMKFDDNGKLITRVIKCGPKHYNYDSTTGFWKNDDEEWTISIYEHVRLESRNNCAIT